jgi:hypothetical protein
MANVRIVLRYQIATYSGEVVVRCNEDTESEAIKAMARWQLKNKFGGVSLPFGYESYKEVSREYEETDENIK